MLHKQFSAKIVLLLIGMIQITEDLQSLHIQFLFYNKTRPIQHYKAFVMDQIQLLFKRNHVISLFIIWDNSHLI